VLAADLFDQNFPKQAFFGTEWKASKYVERENSLVGRNRHLLQKTGHLRKSIRYTYDRNSVTFYSNVPYANIHNEGGDIAHPGGTAFFKKNGNTIWVSNRKAQGKPYPRTKPHNIPIPQRQFVGDHSELQKEIGKLIEEEIMKVVRS
jgi:phage gpG-like protein